MESCRAQKISVSKEEEFDMLLRAYLVNEGYLHFVGSNLQEEQKVVMALDRLVNRGFIKQADRNHPVIYGEGASRYFVSIEDKGKEVVERIVNSKKGKEIFRKLAEHYNSLVE